MKLLSSKTLLALLLLLVAEGCAAKRSIPKRHSSASPPGGPKIALSQVSLLPGSTNSGVMPSLEYVGSSLSAETANGIAAQLEANMVFRSSQGGVQTDAIVALREGNVARGDGSKPFVPRMLSDYTFVITPASPLKDASWYDAVLDSKVEGVALFSDDAYELGRGVVTRFYTASAPQVRRVHEVRKQGQPSRSVIVEMSEQVDTGDLLSGGFDVVSAGSSRKGCVIWNDKCFEHAAQSPTLKAFEYRLDAEPPAKFDLHLGFAVRGRAGKTVGDGANKTEALRGQRIPSPRSVAYVFDRTTWRRRGSPQLFGWSNVE